MNINTGTQNLSYFNTKAVSNSLMSIYEDNFKEFVSYWVYNQPLKQKKDSSLILGTVIDTMLTRYDELDKRFHIYNETPPTGQLLTFIEELVKTSNCNFEVAYAVLKAQNPKLRDSLEKFKERFESEGKKYYEVLLHSDKEVISSDIIKKAEEKIHELQTNKFTKSLINVSTTENISVYYQVEIFSYLNGISLKGALDKVIVDHKKKKVIPIDFKTSFDALQFPESVIKWRYYRQGSFYRWLLKTWLNQNNLQDYEITDFIFIVIGTIKYDQHLIYRLKEEDSKIAEFGGYFKNGERVKGWREIIDEIKYLTDLGDWKYPYDIVINNGIIDLDIFKKDFENNEEHDK